MQAWIGRSVLLLLALAPAIESSYVLPGDDVDHAMVTLIAVHRDGTPVRGFIRCLGFWWKHADEHQVIEGVALPFATDSRGAVIMNPRLADKQITCWSEDRGMHGEVTVNLATTSVAHIVLNRKGTR
jgi:hypothetical protein